MWPTRPDNWRSAAFFGQQDCLALASVIAEFEPVRLAVSSESSIEVKKRLHAGVTVVPLLFDDVWVRDTGPITLVSENAPPVAVHWKFNSWGGLFDSTALDNEVASSIARYEDISVVRAPIVLEGGAIVTDGQGTVILTEESVINENRNPGLTKVEAEHVLAEYLNAEHVEWLPRGLANDEAGGHVDNVCAFTSPSTLLVAVTEDRSHPSYESLQVSGEILRRAKNKRGQPFTVIDVPLPPYTAITEEEARGFSAPQGGIVRLAGTPLAPSHINFYVATRAVLVPTFGCGSDKQALSIIAAAFPDRDVIPFQSREFLLGGGGIHCLTKEIPA